MDENGSITGNKPSRGYGSTGETTNTCCASDDPLDDFNVNEMMIHNVNERYITRIREQSGLSNGPAMVNFQIARSRRRYALSTLFY